MNDRDPRVAELLDKAVPPGRPTAVRWEAVVHDARRPRLRRRVLLGGVPASALALAAVVVAALAWPFGADKGGVLERALAAVGDGPVLHLVIRQGWGGSLVDLETGKRTPLHGEKEVWYDPKRGAHEISRFGGVVQHELLYTPGDVPPYLEKTYSALRRAREALESGRPALVEPGELDGIPVYWIKVHREMLEDVADGKLHEWAQQIAVSRETYEAVGLRNTRDGKTGPDGFDRILKLETLEEGEGDFDAPTAAELRGRASRTAMRLGRGPELSPSEAARLIGGRALWAGPQVKGLELAGMWKDEYASGYSRESPTWKDEMDGLTIFYGSRYLEGSPEAYEYGGPDWRKPHVEVKQVPRPHPAFGRGVRNYEAPEGSLLVIGRSIGRMRRNGVHIQINGSSEDLIVAAARALRPLSASAGSAAGP